MPSVDVAIPCYRYAHYLEGCVASILSQEGVDVRVLILDDCSPDDTPEVGKRLAAADPRVTYRRNEKNLGLMATNNRGCLEWAKAEYMLMLSADDLIVPGALRRAAAVLDANPDVAIAFGPAYTLVEGKDVPTPPDPEKPTYQVIPGHDFVRHNVLVSNPVASPSAVVRTEMQRAVGAYSLNLPHTCDMELWMRLAARHPVAALSDIQALYRWHGSNMSVQHVSGPLLDRRKRLQTYRQMMERDGALVPGLAGWIAEVSRDFARDAVWLAGEAYAAGDVATYKDCMAFVAECDPALGRPGVSLRHRLKRLLGARLARKLAGVKTDESIYADKVGEWFQKSVEFGRWPGSQAVQTL